ncbi:unnamed protein product [Arctogadus glacialis]
MLLVRQGAVRNTEDVGTPRAPCGNQRKFKRTDLVPRYIIRSLASRELLKGSTVTLDPSDALHRSSAL